jgi:hypothetical protein
MLSQINITNDGIIQIVGNDLGAGIIDVDYARLFPNCRERPLCRSAKMGSGLNVPGYFEVGQNLGAGIAFFSLFWDSSALQMKRNILHHLL